MQLGDRDRALAVLAQAAADAERSGMPESYAVVAHTRGDFARLAGDFTEAARQLAITRELSRTLFQRREKSVAPQFSALIEGSCGYLAAATGDHTEAVARHGEALELALDSNDAPIVAHVLVGRRGPDAAQGRAVPRRRGAGRERGRPRREGRLGAGLRAGGVGAPAALGEKTFAEAYAKGLTTTPDTLRPLTDKALAP